MKRILAILMLAALMLSMVACGGGKISYQDAKDNNQLTEPPKTNDQGEVVVGNFAVPSVGYDGSEVTIKFAHTMGQKLTEALDIHIARFNELYPNITIEHDSYGGWADIAKLINEESTAGNHPDIAYCYPDHVAQYRQSWIAVTLDELIKSEIEVTRADGSKEKLGLTQEQIYDFIPGFYNEGKVYGDGLMYTLPMSKSTEVLYYNKTFFEANNLKVPTTWIEMEEVCRQIKALDPKSIPLGYDSEDNMFITMCEQYGYGYTSATGDEKFLFNNDGAKAFAKEFREWHQDGLLTTEALYGAYTSGLFTELDKSISHSYMCIGSSGGASYQIPDNKAFEVGVASVPQVDPANPKVISQGPSLCLLKDQSDGSDQRVVASWLFMKFLTTDLLFQTDFSSRSGYMPVIQSAQENETYANWLNKANGFEFLTAMTVKVGLEASNSYFTSEAFVGSSLAREQVGFLLAKCMSETATDVDKFIAEAFDATYKTCKQKAG